MDLKHFRKLEINGGVTIEGEIRRFYLPPVSGEYADAQLDDYGDCESRRFYPWRAPVRMRLKARFSHPVGGLAGTAGFGFWNAPFGDPSLPRPSLPQAVWFFYASA